MITQGEVLRLDLNIQNDKEQKCDTKEIIHDILMLVSQTLFKNGVFIAPAIFKIWHIPKLVRLAVGIIQIILKIKKCY